jgi:hypothetical protein
LPGLVVLPTPSEGIAGEFDGVLRIRAGYSSFRTSLATRRVSLLRRHPAL